ncbi:hypothetical protein M9H77_12000 [Catharanthus roseus]|uniref:Uncharacterized protein n=1 Tax=Catharanthus roseus TaxID=4058 RepID=A0ACC0BG92_CATRO|nr:hypothetical protein M9H77_12000 [Catharanthus roseus]
MLQNSTWKLEVIRSCKIYCICSVIIPPQLQLEVCCCTALRLLKVKEIDFYAVEEMTAGTPRSSSNLLAWPNNISCSNTSKALQDLFWVSGQVYKFSGVRLYLHVGEVHHNPSSCLLSDQKLIEAIIPYFPQPSILHQQEAAVAYACEMLALHVKLSPKSRRRFSNEGTVETTKKKI